MNVRNRKENTDKGRDRIRDRDRNSTRRRCPVFLLVFFLIVLSGFGKFFFGESEENSGEKELTRAVAADIPEGSDLSGEDSEAEVGETDVEADIGKRTLADIPVWSGSPYVEINGNVPNFSEEDLTVESFETYSELDELGRCGAAYANIGADLMPTEERGDISAVHPTGWQSVQYEGIDGESLYNRCHLIAFSLTAENANAQNLITGTRYLNKEGMLPFEEMVAAYIDETGNHVLYRVTPIFEGDNLVASGVQMEALSVEDDGAGIQFNVYCYNVQPGIGIDYATGDNWLEDAEVLVSAAQSEILAEGTEENNSADAINGEGLSGETMSEETVIGSDDGVTYILNKNTMKFHLPSCDSVNEISEKNRLEYTGDRENVIAMGYEPCRRCNP